MWGLEPRSGAARLTAAAAYLAAVALLVLLQEVGIWLRREERRAWWAGNGRDLLTMLGFAAVTAALRAFGFPAPPALVVGATLTLLLFGTSIFMETRARVASPRAWAVGVGLLFSGPLLLFPEGVLTALQRVATRLFPAGG